MTIGHCDRTDACSDGDNGVSTCYRIHGAIEQHRIASDALAEALTGAVNEEAAAGLTDLLN